MATAIGRRVKKIEKAIKPESGIKIFQVNHGSQEEDFQRQKAEYLKNGGDPNVLFISIIRFSS